MTSVKQCLVNKVPAIPLYPAQLHPYLLMRMKLLSGIAKRQQCRLIRHFAQLLPATHAQHTKRPSYKQPNQSAKFREPCKKLDEPTSRVVHFSPIQGGEPLHMSIGMRASTMVPPCGNRQRLCDGDYDEQRTHRSPASDQTPAGRSAEDICRVLRRTRPWYHLWWRHYRARPAGTAQLVLGLSRFCQSQWTPNLRPCPV